MPAETQLERDPVGIAPRSMSHGGSFDGECAIGGMTRWVMRGGSGSAESCLIWLAKNKVKPPVQRMVSDGRKTQGERERAWGLWNSNRGRRRVRRPRALMFAQKNLERDGLAQSRGLSNTRFSIFVQNRDLTVPGGVTSSMWLHVFCKSFFFMPHS